MKKIYIQIIIVLLLLSALYYIFNNYKFYNKYNIEIERLNKINDSLFICNENIQKQNDKYLKDNNNQDTLIFYLMERNIQYESKIESISQKLNKIKNQYEKAINTANSYNINDIQKYFTNL